MTNREKLAQMSNEDLAELLCRQHTFCVNCFAQDCCGTNNRNGVLIWLEEEVEEDDV